MASFSGWPHPHSKRRSISLSGFLTPLSIFAFLVKFIWFIIFMTFRYWISFSTQFSPSRLQGSLFSFQIRKIFPIWSIIHFHHFSSIHPSPKFFSGGFVYTLQHFDSDSELWVPPRSPFSAPSCQIHRITPILWHFLIF